MEYNFAGIQNRLKKELNKRRFQHTLGVRYTAAALAMRYNYDIKRAEVAGLLHDCAKCFSNEKLLAKCKKYGIEMSEIEARNPYLLHAKYGAFLAKKVYHIEEEDVLQAIIYHTTGRANMSVLEKIIFIADYIEPNRKEILGLAQVRQSAFEDLDQTMYLILCHTLKYLETEYEKKEIDLNTAQAYEYYKNYVTI